MENPTLNKVNKVCLKFAKAKFAHYRVASSPENGDAAGFYLTDFYSDNFFAPTPAAAVAAVAAAAAAAADLARVRFICTFN